MIYKGDVFWIDFGKPRGRGLAYRHPYVVIQGNTYNHSNIGTVVVCGITSKLKKIRYPGNVLLNQKEANLPKESVVNVSQLYTVDKDILTKKIGTLSADKMREIIKGINLLLDADDSN